MRASAHEGNSYSSPWVPFISLACRLGFSTDPITAALTMPLGRRHLLTETKRADCNQRILSTSSAWDPEMAYPDDLTFKRDTWGDLSDQIRHNRLTPKDTLKKRFNDTTINVKF